MANHLRGEITISLGDVTYDCKLNFDSLVRIEKALNISKDHPNIQNWSINSKVSLKCPGIFDLFEFFEKMFFFLKIL